MHTDTDTDITLITSESTETETSREAGPFLPQILNLIDPSVPEGQVSAMLEQIKEAEERTLRR